MCVSVIYQLALTQFDLSLQLMQASTSEDSDVNNNDPHIVDLADISKKYVRKEGLSQMKGIGAWWQTLHLHILVPRY